MKKVILFTLATKNYLEINLTEDLKDLYNTWCWWFADLTNFRAVWPWDFSLCIIVSFLYYLKKKKKDQPDQHRETLFLLNIQN